MNTNPANPVESEDVVIRLSGISKKYNLYKNKTDRLKEALHPIRRKYHREFYALKDINLDIKRGEVLGIVGKNGSGKSTLLKVISSILTPTLGTVEVIGKVVPLLELGSGFNPEYTGMENIYFYSAIMGYTREQIDRVVDDIINFAEIGEFIHQPIKTYSSGMRARLAFAVSVNVNPDILILDEVLSVGDELFSRKCYARMQEFFKGGKTILFVSHSAQAINEICTRAILLDRGKQILDGHPKMVTANYQKYLFAPKGQEEQITQEIVKLDNNLDLKNEIKNEIDKYTGNKGNPSRKGRGSDNTLIVSEKSASTEEKNIVKEEIEDIILIKPCFINNFEPKNTMTYKNYDVDICDVVLLSDKNEKVNVLVHNDWYYLTYKVRFNIKVENISFAMAIMYKKGLVISNAGGTYHRIEKGIHARPGDLFLVKWKFRNILKPDIYFVNVQVSGDIEKQHLILIDIHDATVFKIRDIPNIHFGGFVFMDQSVQYEKFSN